MICSDDVSSLVQPMYNVIALKCFRMYHIFINQFGCKFDENNYFCLILFPPILTSIEICSSRLIDTEYEH